MQLMFDVVLFRMNPEQAIETPRFETTPPGVELLIITP